MSEERRSQSITVSAKTVGDAIAEAEQRLGLPRDEIDITVISEGSKGFLGMGGENARILAMPKAILARRTPTTSRPTARPAPMPSEDELQEATAQAPVPKESVPPALPQPRARRAAPATPIQPEVPVVLGDAAPSIPVAVPEQTTPEQPVPGQVTTGRKPRARRAAPAPEPLAARAEAVAPAQPAPVKSLDEFQEDFEEEDEEQQPQSVRADPVVVAEIAVEVVRELIVRMGIDARATVRSTNNPVVIDILGDDLGLLIGRHGDTLSSLQYLVNAIVGKRVKRWCKVIVDVEHYRMRREETLRSLAARQASRVRQSRQEIILDPMPAAERRVVHMALQNSPWVKTESVGEEPNRRVVIAPRQAAR